MTAQILTHESSDLGEITGARLVGISRRVRGILLHLTEQWYRVGRAPYEDLVITGPEIDEHHCLLYRHTDGSYQIADLGHHGTTRINGHPVTDSLLHNGDMVQIGGYEFSYLTDEHVDVSHLEPKLCAKPAKQPMSLSLEAKATAPARPNSVRRAELSSKQTLICLAFGLGGVVLLSLIAALWLYLS